MSDVLADNGGRVQARLPGTWRLTITFPGGSLKTIISFTSDGTVVETHEDTPEPGVGVWEPGDAEDRFRYTFFVFVHNVSGKITRITRVRSTNRLTNDDRFEGTNTVDFLNPSTEAVTQTFHATQVGVRMKVIPE